MPIHYERDDEGQRIRVMMTGHVTTEDVLGIVDRQAREGTWSYGLLYDTAPSATFRRLKIRIASSCAWAR